MKTLRTLINVLAGLETRIIRRRSRNRAARVAVRIALNGCRV
jgi:hypothetical protein